MQSTFPAQGHKLINTAVPATTSSYISPCVTSLVPADVDLVIVEFSFNDGEMSGWTQVFDAPVRSALRAMLPMTRQQACISEHRSLSRALWVLAGTCLPQKSVQEHSHASAVLQPSLCCWHGGQANLQRAMQAGVGAAAAQAAAIARAASGGLLPLLAASLGHLLQQLLGWH